LLKQGQDADAAQLDAELFQKDQRLQEQQNELDEKNALM